MNEITSNGFIHLSAFDLMLASLLVVLVGVISVVLKLKLEKQLLIASIRTIAQLLMIGYILKAIFSLNNFFLIMLMALVMVFLAGRAAIKRPSRTFEGATSRAFISLLICGMFTTFIVTAVIISVKPWYQPQYMVPILGMILGNGLTGISLTMDHFLESLQEKRAQVEMELAFGASKWEAARRPLSAALKRGMIPIINSMTVVGIVSLPGFMTGQIIGGADPLESVKYQIVVMFMICAATTLGAMFLAFFVYRKMFNDRHQLMVELIKRQ